MRVFRYPRLVVAAMTGHVISLFVGGYEHYTGHPVKGWWLFGLCWFSFYIAAWLYYKEHDRASRARTDAIQTALLEQRKDLAGLRDLITTRDTQLDQLRLSADQLNREVSDKVGCPALVFDIDRQYPEAQVSGSSDFILRNGVGQDALDIRLFPAAIGNRHLVGRMPSLPSGHDARLDYRLVRVENGQTTAAIYDPYHLRETLTEATPQPIEDGVPLKTPLVFRYKNRFGDRFESAMVLYSHPLIRQYPEIQHLRSRRLAANEIDPPELPPLESTTHEN